MALETLADRRAFFADDGITAVVGNTTTNVLDTGGDFEILLDRDVTGLFDRSYYETLDSSGYNPVFLVVDEDAVHIEQDQRLMLLGGVYKVVDVQADGTGFTQLQLHHLGRYVVELARGYGTPYGEVQYGGSRSTFDATKPPLAYPYTVAGVYDKASRLSPLNN